MRILVLSDSHGKNSYVEKALQKVSPLDMIIHLGDLEGSEGLLGDFAPCPVEMIAGNSDYFSRLPRQKIIKLGRHKVLIAHGHTFEVTYGTGLIRQAAKMNGCSCAMFGHTHRPLIEEEDGILLINPGSISKPRQDNKRPSYAVVDVDRHGDLHPFIEYLDR